MTRTELLYMLFSDIDQNDQDYVLKYIELLRHRNLGVPAIDVDQLLTDDQPEPESTYFPIIDEINTEIKDSIDDFELIKNVIAADKEKGDEINAAYHQGWKECTSANINCLRDMLTRIKCIMNAEPIPDLLRRC